MIKNLPKFMVMLALAAVICLPGMASADYVQTWMENGLYGNPPTLKTWDTAEAFLLSPGTWTGTGLTINSGTGWTTTLINPQVRPGYRTGPFGKFLFYYLRHGSGQYRNFCL